MAQKTVSIGDVTFANDQPFVLVGGVNVLESEQFAVDVAGTYKEICAELNIPLVFKASYDKANRSSINSFRGPGLEKGLAIFEAVKKTTGHWARHIAPCLDPDVTPKKVLLDRLPYRPVRALRPEIGDHLRLRRRDLDAARHE